MLPTEMYKILNILTPDIMQDIFETKSSQHIPQKISKHLDMDYRPSLPWLQHCVKSVQRRSLFWSVFSCIWTEYRKIRTRNTPYLDTFHAVQK